MVQDAGEVAAARESRRTTTQLASATEAVWMNPRRLTELTEEAFMGENDEEGAQPAGCDGVQVC